MSDSISGPRCPRCARAIAAWRLAHCVYCGEPFPPDLKAGHDEPEALKWVDRPAIPSDAAKQFEMMKILPGGKPAARRSRPVLFAVGALSIVAFAVIFGLVFLLLRRSSPSAGAIVLIAGGAFLAYLAWTLARAQRGGHL
jgi:hypothetical protein